MNIPKNLLDHFNEYGRKEYDRNLPTIGKFFADNIYLDSRRNFRQCSVDGITKFYNEQLFIESCSFAPLETVRQIYELSVKFKNPININAVNRKGISAFMMCCMYGRFKIAKWLYDLSIKLETPIKNITSDDWNKSPFYICCRSQLASVKMVDWLYNLCIEQGASISIHGPYDNDMLFVFCENIDVCQWLINIANNLESPINIHANNEHAFKLRCSLGNLEEAQWLLEYSREINSPIDIYNNSEHCGVKYNAFVESCARGQLDVAKWLWAMAEESGKPFDVRMNGDASFKNACQRASVDGTFAEYMNDEGEYAETAKWLCTLCNKYCIIEDNDKIVDFQILP
jgi:hypothetical protein